MKSKLTFSSIVKFFLVVGGIALTVLFGGMFVHSIVKNPLSVWNYALLLPLFLAVAAIFGYAIWEVFCSYITFDDESGLTYWHGKSKYREIKVADLESFTPMQNGLSIKYKTVIRGKEKTKRLVVAYFKNQDELAAWLSEHTKNLLEEDIQEQVQEFTQDQYSGLSQEEHGTLLAQWHRRAKALTWCGGVLAALPFACTIFDIDVAARTVKIVFAVCMVYPPALFVVMRLSNGMLRFNVKNASIYPSVMKVFLFPSCMLSLIAAEILRRIYAFAYAGIATVVLTGMLAALYYVCASESEKKLVKKKTGHRRIHLSLFFLWIWHSDNSEHGFRFIETYCI